MLVLKQNHTASHCSVNGRNIIWVKLNVTEIYGIGTSPLFVARGITQDWNELKVLFEGKEQKGLHITAGSGFYLLICLFCCLHGDV